MLQPKSYTQIARPNLYNVAYRRVGMYKGMGKLHPTNYLQIDYRPNMIGATTGQYNTFSGQLSLLPPSLRGLGQLPLCRDITPTPGFVGPIQCDPSGGPMTVPLQGGCAPSDVVCQAMNLPVSSPFATPAGMLALQPGGAALAPYLPVSAGGAGAQYQLPTTTNYIPWIIGAALFAVLLSGGRR